MKVNDYVRTKYGIAKYIKDKVIKQTIYFVIDKHIVYDNIENFENCLLSNEIIKSSPNIIDLIKEGDLVNNHIVGQVLYENQTIDKIRYLDLEGVNILVSNDDIKSIVTKEQFERCEYKIEGEDIE